MKLNEIKLWKFNFLDITLLFVLFILTLAFFTTNSKANIENEKSASTINKKADFTYTIEIKGVADSSSLMIKSGDKIYDKVTGTEMGTITDVNVVRARGYFNHLNGDLELKEVPTRIDMTLTVKAAGSIKNGEYLANDLIRVMVGSSKQFKTKYIMFYGSISSLK